ncbi:FAD-binding oxidoreductase [Nocardia farcinica]|nr:FAD-binding oxidoreductase [Nocardia farcinica]MBF6382437.1 FAD-binding oxidoreductase [Nocardia farcinica]
MTDPLKELTQALGGSVITDPDAMLAYTRDHSVLTPSGRPIAVVRAETTHDVVATTRTAHRYAVPLVT